MIGLVIYMLTIDLVIASNSPKITMDILNPFYSRSSYLACGIIPKPTTIDHVKNWAFHPVFRLRDLRDASAPVARNAVAFGAKRPEERRFPDATTPWWVLPTVPA